MKPQEITDESFEKEVLKSDIPVMIDFWATWCRPCLQIAPTVEEIANEFAGKLKVLKVNIDDNPENAAVYGVRSIPALLFFKNGQKVDTIVGIVKKEKIVDSINSIT